MQPISTTHHSDFDGHFCTPRSVSLQPLLRLMYLGYRFRWPNSRGAPLCIENYDVSSMHFGASNKTEYRTNVESDRLFSTLPTWTTSSPLNFNITPNDLRTVTSFCSNKSTGLITGTLTSIPSTPSVITSWTASTSPWNVRFFLGSSLPLCCPSWSSGGCRPIRPWSMQPWPWRDGGRRWT